jgi:hypothetical protein
MAAPQVGQGGWRRAVAIGLVVLGSAIAFLAALSVWTNRQVLNTDNWTKTSTELLQQPVIRARIADRLSDELFRSVDVEAAVRDVLPPRAQVLAVPAANALRTQVEKQALKALSRPDVQTLWANANRSAHEQLLLVLEGGGSTVTTQNGKVVLNVSQLLAELQNRVGVGGRLRKVLPASASQITVLQSNQLSTAQTVLRWLKPLPVILIVASLACFALALAIAPGWRRRAVRMYGIGFVVAGLCVLLARSLLGDEFVSSLAKTAAAEPALQLVWTIATSLLVNVAVATIAYGCVMFVGAWFAGPTRVAVAARRAVAPYWREPLIAYAGMLVVLGIVVWWAPTPAWRNGVMVVILAALLAAGVEGLRRQIIREFPDATREVAVARHRERWERFTAAGRARTIAARDTAVQGARSASESVTVRRAARFTRTEEDTRIEQLERLARLREAGLLDEEELRAEKARILANGAEASDSAHTVTS